MAEWCADERTVCSHLGHPRGEVVAMLVTILGKPRGEELLKASESTGCEHLCAQRILLELIDVGLDRPMSARNCYPPRRDVSA